MAETSPAHVSTDDSELTASCYYEPIDVPDGDDPGYEYFQPTEGTVSVWSPEIQHGGPPTGLLVRAMSRRVGDDGQVFTRVTMEILGAIGLGINRVRTDVPRPGRRISVVTAELEVRQPDGSYRLAAKTVAWRMKAGDSARVEQLPLPPLPLHPDEVDQIVGFPRDGDEPVPWGRVGFIGTTVVGRQDGRNGATPSIWIRPGIPLVAGEEMTDLESVFTVLDVANGVGVRLNPMEWSWMNVDTTVHLVAQPTSPWLGLDADLAIGRSGYGASFCDLYDVTGFLGRSAQSDLIAPTS